MASYLIPLTCLLLVQDVLSFSFDVVDKNKVAKVGETVTLLCQLETALEFCRIAIPGESPYGLAPQKPTRDGISYFGEGLDKGQCGVKIERVQEKHNGKVNCSAVPIGQIQETQGTMNLVIARAPMRPNLDVSLGASPDYYKEGETIYASCNIRNGRPVANISWYLGDKKLTDGLTTPSIRRDDNDLYSVYQNISRVLQSGDNGKALKCVGQHLLLKENENTTSKQLNVRFPPKPLKDPVEHFGLVEGAEGKVFVIIRANPKPTFIWKVGDEVLHEGAQDTEGRLEVKDTIESIAKGPGNWESVLLIKTLTKEDVERTYTVTAKNNLGDQDYAVAISTSPEPKTLELGAGTITAIVAAVLVILLITLLLVFARAKGRWCFAGNAGHRNAGESSDTESAENHGEAKSKMIFTSVFKKKGDKVSADPSKGKDVTVNDEKVEGDGVDDDGNVSLKPKNEDGVVYAELDLQNAPPSRGLIVRPENDKTEYAEIIHTKDK